MRENMIVDKSYSFAIRIVRFCFEIQERKKEYIISEQLLKSGTGIGANIEEAQGAISKSEFIAKVQIAFTEAKETKFWLRLIGDAGFYPGNLSEQLLIECSEIIIIIASILKSAKEDKQ